jgi:ankyrin repeat protein
MDSSRDAGKLLALLAAVTLALVTVSAQTSDAGPALIQAIQRGDCAAASRLVAGGTSPDVKDDESVPALMLATLFGDAPCVEQLLQRGADPNQADSAGATALLWAMPDIDKARLLLKHGANVNTKSATLGRTPFLIAAAYPGTVSLLELLLAQGADLRAKDAAGFSALGLAMQSSDLDVVRFLADKGLDLNDVPIAAQRAIYARARPAVVDYAIARGVAVPKEMLVRTNWQSPDVIKRWIEKGADTNALVGAYRMTPVMSASASELAGADTVRMLLEHGADPNAQDTEGERPLDWAHYRADRAKIDVLEKFGATRGDGPRRQPVPARSGAAASNARLSVERSVSLLLKSSQGIFAGRRCFTCHHNSMPVEAASLARRKGIPVHEEQVANNVRDILAVFRQGGASAMQAQPTFPGAIALTLGYGMMGLAAERHPLDKATAAMTHWMLATQTPDGSWLGNGVNRPPMEYSTVSHTVIAARGLTLYPIPARRAQIDRALAKARDWLLTAAAPSSEERAMRLLGLVWTKAPTMAVKAAVQEIASRQSGDGGWSQLTTLEPDAYATGLALYALHEAGVAVTDDVYRKGVVFLMSTQYPDGSWFVRTRAFPVQPYFESGFPFGRHQWISAAGTAWAARAMALTLPDATPSARR